MLNYMCKDRKVHAEQDLDSTLNHEKLQVVEVLAITWYRSAIKLGPIPDKELDENVLVDKSPSVWVERVCGLRNVHGNVFL